MLKQGLWLGELGEADEDLGLGMAHSGTKVGIKQIGLQ